MFPYIDTHSHLFLEEFDEDRKEVVARAKEAGVSCIFMPDIDSSTHQRLMDMCDDYPDYCFPLVGLHPESVNEHYEKELEFVRKALEEHSDRFIGIGEIGIDLYWDSTYKKEQEVAFQKQVAWALEFDLPIVVHCRNAFDSIYEVLRQFDNQKLKGIFHCFSAGEGETERMLEFPHFLLGINGIVTFKKSPLPEVLKTIPLERIVVETDAPYLAPVPKRGKRNESAFVFYTLQKVAEIYGLTLDEAAKKTTENVLRVFNLPTNLWQRI